jgi:hypothetical protein
MCNHTLNYRRGKSKSRKFVWGTIGKGCSPMHILAQGIETEPAVEPL